LLLLEVPEADRKVVAEEEAPVVWGYDEKRSARQKAPETSEYESKRAGACMCTILCVLSSLYSYFCIL